MILSTILCTSIFTTTVLATNAPISDDSVVENNAQTKEIQLLRHNMETKTTEISTFVYNPNSKSNIVSLPAKAPTNFAKNNTSSDTKSTSFSPVERLTGSDVMPAVGNLVIYFDTNRDNIYDVAYDQHAYATASLQGPDLLITAAHCVWSKYLSDTSSNGWGYGGVFYAGRTSESSYITAANVVWLSVSNSYVENTGIVTDEDGQPIGDEPYGQQDWAILHLDRNLSNECGYLGLHGCGKAEIGQQFNLVGYPTQMNGSSSEYQQWKSIGTATSIDKNIMKYNAFAYNGFSGGPVMDDYGLVYMIQSHVYNNAYNQPVWNDAAAIRFDDWLFELIVKEREASNARWAN